MWDERFDPVLKLLSRYREFHFLGLHEYLPDIGIDGGVGRIQAMIARCEKLEIPPPRVIITEYGVDKGDDGDDQYRKRKWPGDYYARQLIAPYRSIYNLLIKRGILVGTCAFLAGGLGEWAEGFDYEEDEAFLKTVWSLKDELPTQQPIKWIAPPEPLATPAAWNKGVANLTNFQPDENKIVFLRDIPSEQGSRMARIQPGNSLEYWGDGPQNGWWKVRVAGLEGYASAQYLDPRKRDVTATNEVPVVKPTESETPLPVEAPPAQPPVQETSEEVKDYQFSIIVRARQAEAAEIAAATLALIQAGSCLGRALEPIDIRIEDLSALKEAQPS